jgi:Fe-S cluster assembly protein SufD
MNQAALSIENLQEAVSRLPDDSLTATRIAALADINHHGLPSVRDEDWKYTDLSSAIDISNRWLVDGAAKTTVNVHQDAIQSICSSIDANWLVIANGRIDLALFDASTDVEIERFSESGTPIVMDRPLANLNAALLHDGLRVQLHGATEKPLGVLIIDEVGADASVSQANVEINVAPGCDVEIIEFQHSSGAGDHYSNSVITLKIDQAAQVSYARIQDRRLGHVQTARMSASLGKDAKLNMSGYDIGGGLIRNDIDIDLDNPGAEVAFNGLYLAGDDQHIDNHTRVDHRKGPARSSQEYRGILSGRCRCVWNGKAIVHKGADGTDANQANHNLLLSENAEIDAKPELEIYADDVKCSHGTTVGQLDETALFYLRSRGMDKRQAIQMLTHAFAADLVSRVAVKSAMDAIASLVENRLADLIQEEAS